MTKRIKITIYVLSASFLLFSCSISSQDSDKQFTKMQEELQLLLTDDTLSSESRFVVVNQIATNMLSKQDYLGVTLFLTTYVANKKIIKKSL